MLLAAISEEDREKIKAILQNNDPDIDINSGDEVGTHDTHVTNEPWNDSYHKGYGTRCMYACFHSTHNHKLMGSMKNAWCGIEV